MKQKLMTLAAIVAVTALTSTSRADIYPDATGENFTGAGGGILDITSVEVTNTATDMIFKIKLAGNPVATDWGKYCIGIYNTNFPAAGDISANGNGWTRPISINNPDDLNDGMTHWVGSWVDSGNGAQLYSFLTPSPTAWVITNGASISKTTTNVTITFPITGLDFATAPDGFGQTILFDVYTTGGGGGDSAVDALSRSTASISDWGVAFVSTNLLSYKLQVVTAVPHTVKFAVDMGVQMFEFENAIGNGFNPTNINFALDEVFVRGSFNGFSGTDKLFQEGNSTIFTNTLTIFATPGDTIQYKYEGVPFPGFEQPILTGGANRTLTLTNLIMPTQFACFGDRCLTNPPVSTVNFAVDMSTARNFGAFDPTTNWVTMRGSFNDWGNSQPALQLAPKAAPEDNIYTNSLTYTYYPLGAQNVGFYKFFITNLVNDARDNGWEAPISNGGGNRSFGIASAVQNLSFVYNDETPVINASVEPVNGTDIKVSFSSFPSRGGFPGYPTGGVYAVESRTSLSAPWTTNTIIHSTTGNTAITNTGVLPGTPQQYYRVGLIGL